MIRRDPDYWERLRKDKRSNAASIFAAVAALASTVSLVAVLVPGTHYEARANPLYWLLMLPMVWWVNGLTTYAPRFVRSWMPVLGLCCIANAASLTLAIAREPDPTPWAIGMVVTALAALASAVAYRGSLVAREGPAR